MPSNTNQTTMKIYGTGTSKTLPSSNTLQQRELFVNTFNSFNTAKADLATGGQGFTDANDLGKVYNVTFTGGTQNNPLKVVIQKINSATGAINQIAIVDYGSWSVLPQNTTGTIIATSPSVGTGATITATFYATASIETGGGLYVGDNIQTNKTVQVTGSIAPQNYDNVNITGGNLSNVSLTNATIVSSSQSPSSLTNTTLNSPKIIGGTQTGTTLTGVTVGNGLATDTTTVNLGAPGALQLAYTELPPGISSQGVLVLGSDGKVYITNSPIVTNIQVTRNAIVNGAAAIVGSATLSSTLLQGKIYAQSDVTAFSNLT